MLAVLAEDGCGKRWPAFLVNPSQGKKDKYAYLRVHVHPDNYVYFESVETPGSYVGFNSSGNPCRPKEVAASEDNAKFFVRAEVSARGVVCACMWCSGMMLIIMVKLSTVEDRLVSLSSSTLTQFIIVIIAVDGSFYAQVKPWRCISTPKLNHRDVFLHLS